MRCADTQRWPRLLRLRRDAIDLNVLLFGADLLGVITNCGASRRCRIGTSGGTDSIDVAKRHGEVACQLGAGLRGLQVAICCRAVKRFRLIVIGMRCADGTHDGTYGAETQPRHRKSRCTC